ncbi:MAG: hypothetical protein WCG48_04150 [Candidatus Berkelbacteria bacterium]
MTKKTVIVALAVFLLGIVGFGGYYYWNSIRVKADSPATGENEDLVVNVKNKDGKIGLSGAKVSVIMAEIRDDNVRSAIKSEMAASKDSGNSSVSISGVNFLVPDPEVVLQNVATRLLPSSTTDNPLVEDKVWKVDAVTVGSSGKAAFSREQLLQDSEANTNAYGVPVKIIISYGEQDEYKSTVNLLVAGKDGSLITDYLGNGFGETKKLTKIAPINVNLAGVVNLIKNDQISADTGIKFIVKDINGNPVANASIVGKAYVKAQFNRFNRNTTLDQWHVPGHAAEAADFNYLTDENGVVSLSTNEFKNLIISHYGETCNGKAEDEGKYKDKLGCWDDHGLVVFTGNMDLTQVYLNYSVSYGSNIVAVKKTETVKVGSSWYGDTTFDANVFKANIDPSKNGNSYIETATIDIPVTSKRAISFALDAVQYKAAAGTVMTGTFNLLADQSGKSIQIQRGTKANYHIRLSNLTNSYDLYDNDANPLDPGIGDTRDASITPVAQTLTSTFKLPADIAPGIYQVTAGILGLPHGMNSLINAGMQPTSVLIVK